MEQEKKQELVGELYDLVFSSDDIGSFYDDVEGAVELTIEAVIDELDKRNII